MLKINVIGNLTADVELRTKKGDDVPYAIMRLASDRRYRSKDGDKLTDFVLSLIHISKCRLSGKGCEIA